MVPGTSPVDATIFTVRVDSQEEAAIFNFIGKKTIIGKIL